jgi:transcriptional regulator with XRE-family HTH domain
VYENLKKLREETGLSQQEFGESIGVKKATYSNYETGKTQPGSDFWIAVAEKYDVSIDYLMGFTDDPKRSKFATPSRLDQKYAALDDHGRKVVDMIMEVERERIASEQPQQTVVVDLGTIRRYLSRPAAGPGGMVEGEDYEEIPRTADMPKGADFCVVVSGDSMEPILHDGQTVYVSETAQLHEIEIGVWCVDGEVYIKQYCPLYDGSLHLLSANPKRRDANVEIPRESNRSVQYFGKVLGIKKPPQPFYD